MSTEWIEIPLASDEAGAVTWCYSTGRGTRNSPYRGGEVVAGDTWQDAMREIRKLTKARVNDLYRKVSA